MDVVLFETTYLRSNIDMHETAQQAMESSLRAAYSDSIGDRLVYGNQKGLSILERLEELTLRMGAQEKKLAIQDQKLAFQDQKMNAQEEKITVLGRSSEGYRKIRKRFLATWKRDHLGGITDELSSHIHEGNIAAHGGDALTDADLIATGQCGEPGLFLDIYGLSHEEVLELGHRNDDSIYVLNLRAKIKSKSFKLGMQMPKEVESAWEDYLKTLKAHWQQKPAGNTTSLAQELNTFKFAVMKLRSEE